MRKPLIGSLCSGYGGLDLAVMDAIGTGRMAWHAQWDPDDPKQWAAAILAHRFPGVPNLGDITAIDYATVEPVDVLTAGFPCQDISLAGHGAGIAPGTRSGIWAHVARAIAILRPSLVFIENVRSLTSATAHSDMEPCPWCVGDDRSRPVLRALGAVLGDLADIGFDAEWFCLPASDVGACHQRWRCFVAAWPAHSQSPRQQGSRIPGRATGHGRAAADPDRVGGERDRPRRARRVEPAPHHQPSSHAARVGEREPADENHPVPAGRDTRQVPGSGDVRAASDAEHQGCARVAGPRDPQATRQIGEPARRGPDAASHTSRLGWRQGRTEPAQQPGRPGPVGDDGAPARTDFGTYTAAVQRWERVTGIGAPAPTDDRGRLAPAFVEWMMGLPPGWVTDVPAIPRAAQLKALGNGVMPLHGATALRAMADRAAPLRAVLDALTHPAIDLAA